MQTRRAARAVADYTGAMQVLFLEIEHEREWAVASIGPAFLAACLRAHGHEASLLRVPLDEDPAQLAERVRGLAPDLVGVSLTTRQWLRARELLAALHERLPALPVVAGGLHPTFAAESVLASAGVDFICLGEGEGAIVELAGRLERDGADADVSDIRNIQTRGAPRPTLRPPVEPIDDLPFMARDMLDEHHGVVHMVTQRGCPYPCTYCGARQLADLYAGGYADYGRRRSHANVFAEFERLRATGPLNYVIFLDDTFTIQRDWIRVFCREYAERVQVPFSVHARAETVSETLIGELAAAGCRHIVFGVESGSERLRREVMRRHVDNQRLRDVFRWSRDAGLIATANYIIGTPGETRADIDMTLALHDELQPDDFGCFVFYPYAGTALHALCRERGYLPEDFDELPANHRHSVLRLPDLTPEDIEHYYERFARLRERDQLRRMGDAAARHGAGIRAGVDASAAQG